LSSNKSFSEQRQHLRQQIIALQPSGFSDLALEIFRYQAINNPVYSQYLSNLQIDISSVQHLTDIPFLPIQFFKHHAVASGQLSDPVVTFESSGTTQSKGLPASPSRHILFDADLYTSVSKRIFEEHYGLLKDFHILALLPSYLERNNSSLVYMLDHFIKETGSELSGFYLHNTGNMLDRLRMFSEKPDGKKILLMGVTFALLDLAESAIDLSFMSEIPSLQIMDTGGMKGRRQELLREEVHDILTDAFGVKVIHSEYGMTELLSQAYSNGGGIFNPGYSMRVLLRDVNDPFAVYDHNITASKTGGVNVIDLANIDTCSFIETQDLGRFAKKPDTFYIMGRFDNSDIRGCSLMVI
jgi:phenylacetate-coenzyme A ligase PaaK-like adenylate-forming protein